MDKPSVGIQILAGGIAGFSETLVTYPAEFIKTRRQLPQGLTKALSSLDIIRSTYKTAGFSGFYSGCRALATSNAFKSGIRFLSFETSKDYLSKNLPPSASGSVNPAVNVLAGLSAGISESILVVTPGEALKTRIVEDAVRNGASGGDLSGTVVAIIKSDGILALWKGIGPVLCKQGTNSAVRFTTFSTLQQEVVKRWPEGGSNMLSTLGIGAISGVVTVYASMPFDNIKTRMQSSNQVTRSMYSCAGEILRSGGISGFWKGTSPRLIRLTLSSSITFAVYDQIVKTVKHFSIERQTAEVIIAP